MSDAIQVPWNLQVPEADIYLVGYGNRLPNDFTLEMLAVLRRCKRVFGVPAIHAPEFGIPSGESLVHLYSLERRRTDTYEEMAEVVLDAALADAPVALATYGSAMVGTTPTHRILELAPQRGLTVHVSAAVSSFDGIWADFNIDPCLGFEVWEATAFVRLAIVPDPRTNLLLAQVPVLNVTGGIDPTTMKFERSTTVTELREHLLRYYPPDHEVHFDTTGSGAGPHLTGPDIETVALRDLDHSGRKRMNTLFMPRVASAELDFERPAHAAAA